MIARVGLVLLVAAFLLVGTPAPAQDDIPTPPKAIIELTTAKGTPLGQGWVIEFSGKAPLLPEGTIVEFALFWGTHSLRTFELTIDGSRRFNEKREFSDLVGFAAEVFLRAKIDFLRQPREIQEKMEKDPESFPIERSPWSSKFYPQRFPLGTPAELDSQNDLVKAFFLDSLNRALAGEKAFSSARVGAEDGSRFQNSGEFDTAAWQHFVEKEVRDPLRALQREQRSEQAGVRIIPHERDFKYLNEIINAVALRSYERSRSLYQKLGLSPDPGDFSPKEIDIDCKRSNSQYLLTTTERLCKSQNIDIATLGG